MTGDRVGEGANGGGAVGLRERWQRKRLMLRATALGIYMTTLTLLLALPGYKLPNKSTLFSDKWEHGVAFLLMGLLLWRWQAAWYRPRSRWMRALVAFLAALIFGATMEFVQLFVPRRTFDWMDIAWNGLGGLVAASIALWPAPLRVWIGGESPVVADDNNAVGADQ